MKWKWILILVSIGALLDLITGLISEENMVAAFSILIDITFILYTLVMLLFFDKLKLLRKWNNRNFLIFFLQIPCYIHIFIHIILLFMILLSLIYFLWEFI